MEKTVLLIQPFGFYHGLEDGWKIIKDVEVGENDIELRLVSFLLEGEPKINGYAMMKRAEKMRKLAGEFHAKNLLERLRVIPNEWRDFVLLFAGTLFHCSDRGLLEIPSLRWRRRDHLSCHSCWLKWHLGRTHVDSNEEFDERYRLVLF